MEAKKCEVLRSEESDLRCGDLGFGFYRAVIILSADRIQSEKIRYLNWEVPERIRYQN